MCILAWLFLAQYVDSCIKATGQNSNVDVKKGWSEEYFWNTFSFCGIRTRNSYAVDKTAKMGIKRKIHGISYGFIFSTEL